MHHSPMCNYRVSNPKSFVGVRSCRSEKTSHCKTNFKPSRMTKERCRSPRDSDIVRWRTILPSGFQRLVYYWHPGPGSVFPTLSLRLANVCHIQSVACCWDEIRLTPENKSNFATHLEGALFMFGAMVSVTAFPVAWRVKIVDDSEHRGLGYVR